MNWLRKMLGLNDLHTNFRSVFGELKDVSFRLDQLEKTLENMKPAEFALQNEKIDENVKRANFMMLELKGLISQYRATVNKKGDVCVDDAHLKFLMKEALAEYREEMEGKAVKKAVKKK